MLQIDTAAGTVRVLERKTMQKEQSTLAWLPEAFIASGNGYEHRVAKAVLSRAVSSLGMKAPQEA